MFPKRMLALLVVIATASYMPLKATESHVRDHLPFSEVEGDPSSIIGGCVNILTGSYVESEVDLSMPVPEPLELQRFYNSLIQTNEALFSNWTYNINPYAIMDKADDQLVLTVPESNGGAVIYKGDQHQVSYVPHEKKVTPQWVEQYKSGYTNTGSGDISGKTNLKNQIAWFDYPRSHDIHTYLCDGCTRIFAPMIQPWKREQPLPVRFILRKETRPNGNEIFYDNHLYDLDKLEDGGGPDTRRLIDYVRYTSAGGGQTLNTFRINYGQVYLGHDYPVVKIQADDGREVEYKMRRFTYKPNRNKHHHFYITEVNRPNAPKVNYTYYNWKTWRCGNVEHKIVAGRIVRKIGYYHSGLNLVGKDKIETKKEDGRNHRVSLLYAPVGTDENCVITHRFYYYFDKYINWAQVVDAREQYTCYIWDKQERLKSIRRCCGGPTKSYYCAENFFWGHKDSNQLGNLISKALVDEQGIVRSCRFLEYDSKHNVTAEHTIGNLSGICTSNPTINADGIPALNGCEEYIVRRGYTHDSHNRLHWERHPNGKEIVIDYRPGTHLITKKLIKDDKGILAREFHVYDDYGVTVKTIHDDGQSNNPDDLSGVTCRKITYITPRHNKPCFGLPEVVEERYLDLESRTEQFLSKTVYTYSKEGWVTQEDHYDSHHEHRYSIRREFDYMGNPIIEQNALGHITEKRYDAWGNKIYEQGPDHSFHFEYTYDTANRLIAEERVCDDGRRFKKSYRYDHCNNKIAYVDTFGQETVYRYDPLGRLIETVFPPFVNDEGKLIQLSSKQEYDIANNVVTTIDVDGNVTQKTYNIRGKPVTTQNPDGSNEQCVYNLDGTLKEQTAVNGLTTKLSYDTWGNCIRKDIYSQQGQLLSTTSAIYQCDRLLSETDANGNITTYQYDGAARLIAIIKPSTTIRYTYDSLGRRHKTIQTYGSAPHDVRITITEYDLLQNILEERQEDYLGNVLTRTVNAYDMNGQRTHVTTYSTEGACTTITTYNSHGQVCSIVDAERNETLTHYDYDYRNAFQQRVLRKTVVDPLGIQTITTYDALGRAELIERKDKCGELIAKATNAFDAKGNLTKRIDTVIAQGKANREVITLWRYDALGRVVELTEGAGTQEQRRTSYVYNSFGQKDSDILSNGSVITYRYDDFGRLCSYFDSEQTFVHEFAYDSHGNVIQTTDRDGFTICRSFDNANRLATETVHGKTTQYQYDGLGRITRLTLPDGSVIASTYDPAFLKTVKRIDPQGRVLYQHQCESYDLSGHLLKATRIANAGEVTYTRDKLFRVRSALSAQFSEIVPEEGYDKAGNLLSLTHQDAIGEVACHYTYGSRYQLTSETGLSTHQYLYDSLDNRISKDHDTCDLNSLNQLMRQGERHFTYDRLGNRSAMKIGDNTMEYAHDALGRLISVTDNITYKIRYLYDGFNRRIASERSELVAGHWTVKPMELYLHQEQMEIGKMNAVGKLDELRVLGQGLGAEIGAAIAVEVGDRIYAPIHNHSGHVVALIDADSGRVAEVYRYTAFGEADIYVADGSSYRKVDTSANPWRFASKRHDIETGLIHFGRRHYDPVTARWTSPDPAGYGDGPNLYAYVHNQPLTHFDLYGLLALRCQYCGGLYWNPSGFMNNVRNSFNTFCRNTRNLFTRQMYHCPYWESWRPAHMRSRNYELIPSREIEGGNINFTCGVKNNQESLAESAEHVSSLNGNANVCSTHNASGGILVDLVECVLGLLGITTEPVICLHRKWNEQLAKGGTILEVCHSQGAIHVRNALMTYPKELRDRILVLAIAPAAYIQDNLCRQVIHYRHESPLHDPVPYIDRRGARLCRHTTRELASHPDAGWFDHSFTSKTYEDRIQQHLSIYERSGAQRI